MTQKRLTPIARALRSNRTEAEALLWRHLRNRQLENAKFRQQSPTSRHVADFRCEQAKLVVELDGGHHGEQTEADAERTAALEAAGYTVLRFWNPDVLNNIQGVLEAIREQLNIARNR